MTFALRQQQRKFFSSLVYSCETRDRFKRTNIDTRTVLNVSQHRRGGYGVPYQDAPVLAFRERLRVVLPSKLKTTHILLEDPNYGWNEYEQQSFAIQQWTRIVEKSCRCCRDLCGACRL